MTHHYEPRPPTETRESKYYIGALRAPIQYLVNVTTFSKTKMVRLGNTVYCALIIIRIRKPNS